MLHPFVCINCTIYLRKVYSVLGRGSWPEQFRQEHERWSIDGVEEIATGVLEIETGIFRLWKTEVMITYSNCRCGR
jgi:hypothetical protein